VTIPLYLASALQSHPPRPLFTPTSAICLLTLGVLLIFIELNRPGRVIPGAIGLLLALLAVPSLSIAPHPPAWLTLFATPVILIGLGLRRRVPTIIFAAATLALALAFTMLQGVPWELAAACGILLGTVSSVLAHIAHRARRNKGLD
jgi:membrane-bound serine protease (ClpP class)